MSKANNDPRVDMAYVGYARKATLLVMIAVISTWTGVSVTLIFGPLYDLLMSPMDSFINIVCVICSFTCFDSLYYHTLGKLENKCLNLCFCTKITGVRIFSHSMDQKNIMQQRKSSRTNTTDATHNRDKTHSSMTDKSSQQKSGSQHAQQHAQQAQQAQQQQIQLEHCDSQAGCVQPTPQVIVVVPLHTVPETTQPSQDVSNVTQVSEKTQENVQNSV